MDEPIVGSNEVVEQGLVVAQARDTQIFNIKSQLGVFRPTVVLLTVFLGTLGVGIITFVIITFSASLPKLPPWVWIGALGVTIGGGLVANTKRIQAKVKRLPHILGVADIEYLAKEYQRVAGARFWNMSPFISELVKLGRTNLVIRYYKKQPELEVVPLSVVFDPCPIDECQPRFVELAAEDTHKVSRQDKERDFQPKSSIARQVIVKGGWFLIICFGFNAIVAGIDSIERGRVTWQLVMWSANILIFLLVPTTGLFGNAKQVFLVNGGVLRRQKNRKGPGSELHIYRRGDSNLGIIEMGRGRHRWMAYVADKELADQFVMTATEGRLLLRAWFSPLEPPSVERLKDFE